MHKLTKKVVAIKSLKKSLLTDEESKRKVMQEFSILKFLNHPSVIRLYETFETKKYILFVMELCSGGDLLNYVRKHRKLKEDVARLIFKQLIEGLHHCHSRGILHRDIKLDNILLNSKGAIKICDFGVSKLVKNGEVMREQCGTPAYMAPEILKAKGYEGFAADIWSAGVALYVMLYKEMPFKGPNLHKVITMGAYKLGEKVSKEGRDLIERMLERNPKKRISVEEILKHKWMVAVDKSIKMFSEAEKMNIRTEYPCSKSLSIDGKLFTELNIDVTESELLPNTTTKSVVLGPFNTWRSNASQELNSNIPLYEKGEILKLGFNAKEADKVYEKNNNKDLDNGVYNNTTHNNSLEQKDSCISEGFEKEIEVKEQDYWRVIDKEANTIKPFIDEEVLMRMENYGFNKEHVIECLRSNKLNYGTSTYHLLTNS